MVTLASRGVLGFRSQEGLRGGKPRKETQPSKPEIPTSNSSMLVPRTTHGQSNTSIQHNIPPDSFIHSFIDKDKRSQRKVADSTTELDKTNPEVRRVDVLAFLKCMMAKG